MSANEGRLTLPGGKAAVGSFGEWLQISVASTWLLGPHLFAMRAAAHGRRRDVLHRLERSWAGAVTRLLRMRLSVAGLERIERGTQYVVAPLHEGFADALALLSLPLDLAFAARDELFDWRFLGPYLRASGQIEVSTPYGASGYRALLRAAPEVFARGESLVVFPQGSILGIEIAFTRGVFRLADKLARPLLPVVITGTHRVWEHPYGPTVRFGVPARLEVLEPIPVGRALEVAREVEHAMKRIALDESTPPARRYVPEEDGWWDGYPFEIDPQFPDLASRVAAHRTDGTDARAAPDPDSGMAVSLDRGDHTARSLSRLSEMEQIILAISGDAANTSSVDWSELGSLPGVVADVTAVAPGAVGRAVPISVLLDRVRPGQQATHVTVISSDGSYRASIPLDEVATGGWLAFALDDAPLPAERGGPLRLTVAEGTTLCWNVKDVAEMRFTVGSEPDDVPEKPPH